MSKDRLTLKSDDAKGIRITSPEGVIVLPRNMKKKKEEKK